VAAGDWLVRLFDRWFDAPRKETSVRLLEEIINLVLGGASRSDQVGLSPSAVVVVETDGAIEQTDSLKSAYEGAAATGLSVLTDTSTMHWRIRDWSPANSAPPRSVSPVWTAGFTGPAAVVTTLTATVPARASGTRPSTVLICSGSSTMYTAGWRRA